MTRELPVKQVANIGLRYTEAGWGGDFCECTQKTVEDSEKPRCREHPERPMHRINRGDPIQEITEHQNRMMDHKPRCFNLTLDLESGKYLEHELVTIRVPVVDLQNKEWHLQEECRTCHAPYGWSEGRAATEPELVDCAKGKIARRAKLAMGHN